MQGVTDTDMVTVILADGDFPSAKAPLEVLHKAGRIICCDGAAETLLRYGRTPDFIAGDLDSLPNRIREQFPERLIHSSDQECNDLTKAFQFALAQGWNDLVILGAAGMREDHTIANFSLLADYAEKVPSIRMITDYGTVVPVLKPGTFSAFPGQQISIFTLSADARITSSGLKFPMKDFSPDSWWQMTLNEACGTEFSLNFREGARLLLYFADEESGKKNPAGKHFGKTRSRGISRIL